MQMLDLAQQAKAAALRLATLPTETKNRALFAVADALIRGREPLLEANREDVIRTSKLVERGEMARPLLDRLKLSDDKILAMAEGVRSVAELPDPVGCVLSALELDDGLEMTQVTTPLGVIGAIFESRPDAVPQIASLCWKSGNAVIMKGGSEAQMSNRFLGQLIRDAIATVDERSVDAVQMVETREDVNALLALDEYIDLFVPRGSNAFVRYIQDNTRVPVLGHAEGLCHAYVDAHVDLAQAVAVCYDAKVQYPAVCNAIETVLVHRDVAEAFLPMLASAYRQAGVEMRGCEVARSIVPEMIPAVAADWETEYLDLIVSIKVVESLDDAIAHINRYGSSHTETILTQDAESAIQFLNRVDAATVMHNASTRFADGFRFGKGAEVGISTNKTHARGPVGLDGLVIYKYCLVGQGHIVADYAGPNAKPFTHQPLLDRGAALAKAL
ncbi:glutamate-5-semialdehyde dehydrogenase [Candidatus Entotheonella palauensis]|uniref:Gamma-glutamyl phosphate reductase n=1 Tax=Candidatus Entotheonella gemina TaxID=1429439 RepID=W4MFT8_9BACT|nr:glutamate-5-semialdehyde dehydrogenase [Candidatus Entotheonella palauensis]ETX09055.1 MAG: gamma-glutamyl phosphate reductase [Candidatus Entotheonella gemina]